MSFTVRESGLTALRERLGRLENADLSRLLRDLGGTAVKLVDRGFAESRSPYGNVWAPNTPETIRLKGSSKPLIRTGRLRHSIRAEVRGVSVAIGSPVEYAPAPHLGTNRVPVREYLPMRPGTLPADWRDELLAVAQAWVTAPR